MSLKEKKIAFLGAGNMAEALMGGILSAELLPAKNILASDVDKERLKKLEKEKGIQVATSNQEAVQQSDILFLAVKPQNLPDLFSEISDELNLDKLLISIAAGMKIEKLEAFSGKELRLIRVMPNLPALVQSGVSALYKGKKATEEDLKIALTLLSAVGEALEVKQEEDLDAVTALSGSGPGYLFYFAEALYESGIKNGLSPEITEKLVTETLLGSSKLLKQSKESASELRKKVTSKGGTTEAAINLFKEQDFVSIVEKSVTAAVKRSKELSQ